MAPTPSTIVHEIAATRDVDFLGFGKDDDAELKNVFGEFLAIDADDGLIFDAVNLDVAAIREDQIYGGMRLKTAAYLGKPKSQSLLILDLETQ